MDESISILKIEEAEEYVIISVYGFIDEPNAKEIWESVLSHCGGMNKNIILDLSNVSFFSSGGASMGGLLQLRYKLADNDKTVLLVGLYEKMRDEITSWGLSVIFHFSLNNEAAKRQLKEKEFIKNRIKENEMIKNIMCKKL